MTRTDGDSQTIVEDQLSVGYQQQLALVVGESHSELEVLIKPEKLYLGAKSTQLIGLGDPLTIIAKKGSLVLHQRFY